MVHANIMNLLEIFLFWLGLSCVQGMTGELQSQNCPLYATRSCSDTSLASEYIFQARINY